MSLLCEEICSKKIFNEIYLEVLCKENTLLHVKMLTWLSTCVYARNFIKGHHLTFFGGSLVFRIPVQKRNSRILASYTQNIELN